MGAGGPTEPEPSLTAAAHATACISNKAEDNERSEQHEAKHHDIAEGPRQPFRSTKHQWPSYRAAALLDVVRGSLKPTADVPNVPRLACSASPTTCVTACG
jgi:hypothetical protein